LMWGERRPGTRVVSTDRFEVVVVDLFRVGFHVDAPRGARHAHFFAFLEPRLDHVDLLEQHSMATPRAAG